MAQTLQNVEVKDLSAGSTGFAIVTGQISSDAGEVNFTFSPGVFAAAGLDDAEAVTQYKWVDGNSSVNVAPVTVALDSVTQQQAILTFDATAVIVNFIIIGRRTS